MATLLALWSALIFGLIDFAAALLARRGGAASIAALVQLGGLLLALPVAISVSAGMPATATLGWGALSGIGTGVGIMFLYLGMRRGQLCVVVPVSAVAAIALPALAGVLFLGERPSAQVYIGIVAAATALWLVSCGDRLRAALQAGGALEGAIAGVGFALQSTAVFMPGDAAGYWPLAANRLAAMCTVAILARSLHLPLSWRSALARPALALGAAAVVSLALYLHAARLGLMSTAVAISSLYPVVPALLGVYVLRERLAPLQVAGLAMAALAVALIAMG